MSQLRRISIAVVVALFFSSISYSYAAAPKTGAVCSKVGKKQVASGKTFTCVKKGKKLVWSKGVKVAAPVNPVIPSSSPSPSVSPSPETSVSPTPSPTPTPTPTITPTPEPTPSVTFTEPPMKFADKLWSRGTNGVFPIEKETYAIPAIMPTGWDDVYEKRLGIPYQAWLGVSKNIASNPISKVGNVEILVGPNTVPNFAEIKSKMDLVSRALPSAKNASSLRVFAFNFKDHVWADETFKRLYANETTAFRNRHVNPAKEICPQQREVCFAQAFVDSNLKGVIFLGMTDKGSREQLNQTFSEYARASLGYVIGHEYLHTIQRVILGERWFQRDYTPPSWFNEGSAVFMENAASNKDSFDTFMQFRDVDSKLLYADCPYDFCVKIDEAKVLDYLSLSHRQSNWDNFPYAMKYEMSARIIEILVALKGPESIIRLVEVMSTQKTFDRAFEEVYGVSYELAKPKIAKIVAEQFSLN